MDFDKLKKDLEERKKGIEKGKEELDNLKGRLGNFNSGQVNTTTTSRTRPIKYTWVRPLITTQDRWPIPARPEPLL